MKFIVEMTVNLSPEAIELLYLKAESSILYLI